MPASLHSDGASRLKIRAPRQKVLIRARMRISAGWNDACILDISERGLMIRAGSAPPRRGSCVELRRGARIIIGRVMWAKQDRFGLSTQDKLDVESIIAVPDGNGVEDASSAAVAEPFDGVPRSGPRPPSSAVANGRGRSSSPASRSSRWPGAWWRSRPSRNCSPHRWPRSSWDWVR
jgi:hypothetical protein